MTRIGALRLNDKRCSPKVFKNGAVWFFGRQPDQLFDTAVVRCIAFEGDSKTYIIDDKTFGGPLYVQYQQAMQWLKQKLSVRYIIEGSGPRKEIYEIPEDALKELLLNALSHRDYYDRGASITVELFDDRLEIVNPGGLVSAIPKEEFGKRSHSRNPLIFGLFVRMYMVERIGSGIKRVRDAMSEAQLPSPEFSTEGMFVATLKRPPHRRDVGEKLGEKLTKNQTSIVEAILRNN